MIYKILQGFDNVIRITVISFLHGITNLISRNFAFEQFVHKTNIGYP